ncbi:MAG: hypothetical protein F4Y34_08115 [Gammaproteobacteria bacterium]|nr:hypothetical protein [Gammaproteobacteria bacterium]MYH86591.1 hypothetical protein [Gammaproteobacteria bacterium]
MKTIWIATLSLLSLLFSATVSAQSVDFSIGEEINVEQMGLELDFVQGERFIQAYGAVVPEEGSKIPVDGACLIEEREDGSWATCTLSFLIASIWFSVSLADGNGLATLLVQDDEPEEVDLFIWIREN